MHELSIALGIVEAAEEAAGRERGRPVAVHLRLGPLSGVAREALLSAWELAREGTPLDGAALEIEDVPVAAYCPACAAERAPPWPELRCPDCGGPTPEVLRGRELEVFALEVES
jgi:hydrogenase nickel incorporation protein HypA/HybF